MTTIARELTPGQREALRLALLDGSSAVATLEDIAAALENLPPSGLSEAEVEAIAAEGDALLSRALPSGRVAHVGAGRDYTTLSAAYAALGSLSGGEALSATNRFRLHLWGDIVETATVTALNHVDLVFEAGARLIVELPTGPAATAYGLNVSSSTISVVGRSSFGDIILRHPAPLFGGVRSFAFSCVNPAATPTQRSRISNMRFVNEATWSRAAGAQICDAAITDCEAWSNSTGERGHGFFFGGNVRAERCYGYSGFGGLGAGISSVAGASLHANHPLELIDCAGYSRGVAASQMGFGIWTYDYVGPGKAYLLRCRGYGSAAGELYSHGIAPHKSANAILDDCLGVSGVGFGSCGLWS